MTLQTFGVIVFLIWTAYLLIVPANKVNLPFVVIMIAITMFCIGGLILLIMFFLVIGLFWLLTKL